MISMFKTYTNKHSKDDIFGPVRKIVADYSGVI
jgi:hypothetical protein